MTLHAVGFGSLNIDEFWEVPSGFLESHGLRPGEEYVRDVDWFNTIYPQLLVQGAKKAAEPGGSAANMIAALRRLGYETGFYGATGEDGVEALRLDELGRQKHLRIAVTRLPAGRCLALIDREDESKDRCLVILPNANDLAGTSHLDPDFFAEARWVHMTSFVSLQPLAAQTIVAQSLRGGRTKVSFDPGAVYCGLGLQTLEPVLAQAEILFTTPQELATLTSLQGMVAALEVIFETGVKTVVMKRGSQGISAFTPGTSIHQPAIAPAAIRDRTGAGDVAAAGFLAGVIESWGTDRCLQFAAIAAAKSIEGYGRTSYPDRSTLDQFLRG